MKAVDRLSEYMRPRRNRLALALAVLAAGVGIYIYSEHQSEPITRPVVLGAPVVVATVAERTMPIELDAIGSVEAYSTVAVKSRIDGQILSAHFRQGGSVHKEQLLFTLDPRQSRAQLQQTQANLSRDRAQLENAQIQLLRAEDLVKKDYIPRDQYDNARATADAAAATVRADQAAVENARVQLDYTRIRSPIDGIAGSLLVYPGNVVKANDTTPLVVINQTQPIYVTFSVPQQYLLRIRERLAAGALAATARLAGLPAPEQGKVVFINNAVDATTGTIQLKARFENADRALVPGQYANVKLVVDELKNVTVIPAQAVQTSQSGPFVFVVRSDLTVEQRPIVVAATSAGYSAIRQGLSAGEKVVTDGQLGLVSGAKVEPRTAGPEGGS